MSGLWSTLLAPPPSTVPSSSSSSSFSSYWSLVPISVFLGNVVRLIGYKWQAMWMKLHPPPLVPSAITPSSLPPLPSTIEIVGHRGLGILTPENTMAGFHLGLTLPMSCMETDLWMTCDGVVVLIHGVLDPEDQEEWVPNMTWEQLHHKKPYVPQLSQVLSLLADHPESSMNVCLELKWTQWSNPANMQHVLDLITASRVPHPHSRIMFSSFWHDNLMTLHGLDAQYKTGALINPYAEFPPLADLIQLVAACHASEVHLYYKFAVAPVVTALHNAGYRVMAWFGMQDDTETELRALVTAGCNKICTNRPDRLAYLCGWKPTTDMLSQITYANARARANQ